jgi:tRNA modification GTPase
LGDYALRLIDTAGLNPAAAELERLGIEKSIECMEAADIVLLVVDGSLPMPTLPEVVLKKLDPKTTLLITNKSDLPTKPVVDADWAAYDRISTSMVTSDGLEQLRLALQNRAASFHVELGDDLIAVNARHADALSRAKLGLETAKHQLLDSEPIELLASELRGALAAYGEIAGKIDNERMLDHLFATFCIGK